MRVSVSNCMRWSLMRVTLRDQCLMNQNALLTCHPSGWFKHVGNSSGQPMRKCGFNVTIRGISGRSEILVDLQKKFFRARWRHGGSDCLTARGSWDQTPWSFPWGVCMFSPTIKTMWVRLVTPAVALDQGTRLWTCTALRLPTAPQSYHGLNGEQISLYLWHRQ